MTNTTWEVAKVTGPGGELAEEEEGWMPGSLRGTHCIISKYINDKYTEK